MTDEAPAEKQNLSHVPSWLMLGFLLGVGTMWTLRSDPKQPPAPPAPVEVAAADPATLEPNSTALENRPSLDAVEALFEQYRDYAFWSDERTQIALWNSQTMAFSDHVEVVRTDEGTYYRPIRTFTRLLIENYGPPGCPVVFTETAEQQSKRFFKAHPDKLPKQEPSRPIDLDRLPRPPAPGGR